MTTREPFDLQSVRRFNLICRALVLCWLLVGVPLLFKFRPPAYHDFSQFYMGGVIARHAAWEALYPVPLPQSPYNPGLADDSTMRPQYAKLADDGGVGDEPRFIQPPPDALLFEPLAFLSYSKAKWAWVMLQCAAAGGIALLAGCFYERAAGRSSKLSGVVTLMAGGSYLLYITVRALNQEALIGLLLALATWQLTTQKSNARRVGGLLNGASLALAAMLKYAGAVLLPLVLVMRRGTAIVSFLIVTVLLVVATLLLGGRGPFIEYGRLFPLLGRPYEWEGNQSLTGLLLRAMHRVPPLPTGANLGVRIAATIAFVGICGLLVRRPREEWKAPAKVLAAAALLISWMLVFSPLTWNKYFVYLLPLWGWLVFEAAQRGWRRLVVIAVIALTWGPWEEMEWFKRLAVRGHLGEIAMSHMLWALVGMAGVAVARIRKPLAA